MMMMMMMMVASRKKIFSATSYDGRQKAIKCQTFSDL